MRRLVSHITILCCIQFLLNTASFGQIIFDRTPQDHMFLAQNKSLSGSIYKLKGKVSDLNFSRIYIDIYKDGVFLKSNHTKLKRVGNELLFDFAALIPTAKSYYKLIFRLEGGRTYITEVDSVLVGDVYLIQGQSNAVAADYRKVPATAFDTSYNSDFIRSFGTSSPNWYLSQNDIGWYPAEASNIYTKGAIGQWAAVMAKNLLDSFDTPICLLNGAVGGTPVNFHLPDNTNHFNVFTNYGRLLSRTENAGFRDNIAGIFYFQGESDGSLATKHDTMFREIIDAWKLDYPNFGKLYVIQVRSGCGNPSIQLREAQRQFGLTIDRCQTVSANGLNGHDGCHYNFKDGYEALGLQLSQLVSRDLYGSGKSNVDPPDISKVIYNNSEHTKVKLIMRRPSDSLFTDPNFHSLFQIVGDPSLNIVGGELIENEIILSFNKASCLPIGLSYDGIARSQTWVKNKTGMGMLSCYNVPVLSNNLDTSLFACKNQSITLGSDSVQGYKYKWTNLKSNNTSFESTPVFNSGASTTFELILKHGPSNCPQSDSLLVKVNVDSVDIPKFQEEYVICEGEAIDFKPSTQGYSKFMWNSSIGWTYTVDSTLALSWVGRSSNGCIYSDSIKARLSVVDLPISDEIFVCNGEDTLITVQDSFIKYYWNGISGSNKYQAETGTTQLKLVNQDLCSDSVVFSVSSYLKTFHPRWDYEICEGEELGVHQPVQVKDWFINDRSQENTIKLISEFRSLVTWVDSLGCYYSDSIVRIDIGGPEVQLPDTGFCEDGSLSIRLDSALKYLWSDGSMEPNRIIDSDGLFSVSVKDENGCMDSTEFKVEQWQTPVIEKFKDTLLCQDSSWLITLADSYLYLINGVYEVDTIRLFPGRDYNVSLTNTLGCNVSKSIEIGVKECLSSVRVLKRNDVKIYPNPSQGLIHFESLNEAIVQFSLLDSKGKVLVDKRKEDMPIDSVKINESPGLYFIHLEFANGEYYSDKIILE